MDETFPDLGSLSDAELKDVIRQLTEEETEISYQRRILHGKIDILRAELVNRLRSKHDDGEALITNSAVQILLKQAPQAMPRLAELFRLTRAEQSWLLNAHRGEGLLVAQGRRVPFSVVSSEEEARLIEMTARTG